jgi:hypothetical protein
VEKLNILTCYKHYIRCGGRNYTSVHYKAGVPLYQLPPYACHFGANTELRTYNPSLGSAGLLLWNFDAIWSVVSCWRLALDFRAILRLVSFELSWRNKRQECHRKQREGTGRKEKLKELIKRKKISTKESKERIKWKGEEDKGIKETNKRIRLW